MDADNTLLNLEFSFEQILCRNLLSRSSSTFNDDSRSMEIALGDVNEEFPRWLLETKYEVAGRWRCSAYMNFQQRK